MPAPNLPAWAAPHPTQDNTVLVDPDLAYPALLDALGVKPAQRTKYWIEVAYQCVKMDLQVAMGRFGFTIHIRADDGRKERWALDRFPGAATDIARATKGGDARAHYRRLRGFVPG